jgi:hypothetical protein
MRYFSRKLFQQTVGGKCLLKPNECIGDIWYGKGNATKLKLVRIGYRSNCYLTIYRKRYIEHEMPVQMRKAIY